VAIGDVSKLVNRTPETSLVPSAAQSTRLRFDRCERQPVPTADDEVPTDIAPSCPKEREPADQPRLHNAAGNGERQRKRQLPVQENGGNKLDRGDHRYPITRHLRAADYADERMAHAEQSLGQGWLYHRACWAATAVKFELRAET
jgi:hypothetical protein